MNVKRQGMVKNGKAGKKDNSAVTGIHVKVKEHLEVIKDSVGDIVGLINNKDRSDTLIKGKAGNFSLDDLEVISFSIGRDKAELINEGTVEIHNGEGGHSRITDLVEGRVQRIRKVSDDGSFAKARGTGEEAEAFGRSKVIEAE